MSLATYQIIIYSDITDYTPNPQRDHISQVPPISPGLHYRPESCPPQHPIARLLGHFSDLRYIILYIISRLIILSCSPAWHPTQYTIMYTGTECPLWPSLYSIPADSQVPETLQLHEDRVKTKLTNQSSVSDEPYRRNRASCNNHLMGYPHIQTNPI